MRRLRGGIRQRLTELCRPDGSIAQTSEDVLAEATRYFGVLQTATRDVDETPPLDGDLDRTDIGPGGDRAPLLDKITDDLVGEILARTPKKRAKGADGLMGETLRCLPPRGVTLVARLFRAFWSHGMPAFMKHRLTILLYKKGDARHLKNWRPIGLVKALSKAYTSTMKEVIYAYVEEHGILSAAQNGFREIRGSEQALRLLTSVLEDAAVARRDVGLTYIDFSSGFNTVPHDGLVLVMRMLGIPTDAVAAVSDLYTSATTSVSVPQGHTDPIPVGTGTIQGDPLGPLLWALFKSGWKGIQKLLILALYEPLVLRVDFRELLQLRVHLHLVLVAEADAEVLVRGGVGQAGSFDHRRLDLAPEVRVVGELEDALQMRAAQRAALRRSQRLSRQHGDGPDELGDVRVATLGSRIHDLLQTSARLPRLHYEYQRKRRETGSGFPGIVFVIAKANLEELLQARGVGVFQALARVREQVHALIVLQVEPPLGDQAVQRQRSREGEAVREVRCVAVEIGLALRLDEAFATTVRGALRGLREKVEKHRVATVIIRD